LATSRVATDAIGHRIVFGGPDHVQPERITDTVVAQLENLASFDPLHVPIALDAIAAVESAFPGIPQVACYDTAFHARLPEIATRFALPRNLYPEIRRYGYHGLSYEYVVWKLGDRARGRLVVAHLGSGASVAAIRDGEPVDTSMGLTPLGGLVMGTRCGDLDPGVIIRLLRSGRTLVDVADMVTSRSGLLGVSGTTSDMRELLARRVTDSRAEFAVALFVASTRKWIAAMAASLEGLDRLVFTGGIGEHSAEVRSEICRGLAHLGVGSTVATEVVATDESLMVARHTFRLVAR
jgi:acetate kinase